MDEVVDDNAFTVLLGVEEYLLKDYFGKSCRSYSGILDNSAANLCATHNLPS